MNTGIILDYLTGLAGNNNREWYHAHKKEYQEANEEFIALLQELIWRKRTAVFCITIHGT